MVLDSASTKLVVLSPVIRFLEILLCSCAKAYCCQIVAGAIRRCRSHDGDVLASSLGSLVVQMLRLLQFVSSKGSL